MDSNHQTKNPTFVWVKMTLPSSFFSCFESKPLCFVQHTTLSTLTKPNMLTQTHRYSTIDFYNRIIAPNKQTTRNKCRCKKECAQKTWKNESPEVFIISAERSLEVFSWRHGIVGSGIENINNILLYFLGETTEGTGASNINICAAFRAHSIYNKRGRWSWLFLSFVQGS